jgi:hypothetical protein
MKGMDTADAAKATTRRMLAATLLLGLLPVAGWGGNNIGVWFRQRENAPEILTVRVERVRQDFAVSASGCPMASVTLTARVTGVTRSGSGLKPGSPITIHYNRRPVALNPFAMCGPISIPVPRAGTECAAYLAQRRSGEYAPFVDGYEAFLTGKSRRLPVESDPWWWPVAEHPILTGLLALAAVGFGVRAVRQARAKADGEA